MFPKIKNKINQIRFGSSAAFKLQNEILKQTKELEWAHIFHDSIRGKKYLEELPLNVGRWAGNYSFFYVLNRILSDCRPKKILDLGLGESSKMISTYLENYLHDSHHTIVEQNEEWIQSFQNRFAISDRSKIIHCELEETIINGYKSYSYKNFDDKINGIFDLYIVDGPFGSDRYSRYNIVRLLENISSGDDFIIMMDDSDRIGEQDTINDLCLGLKAKNVNYSLGTYSGTKSVTVIVTPKYKYVTSL